MKVEVCVSSVESARVAEAAGADRLELCGELAVGGVTPSPGLLQAVREAVRIPVHVLIRPRSGDFCYSEWEFEQMLLDIAFCRRLGFEGFALGCLQADGRLDRSGMQALAGEAGPSHLTFHRAFDRMEDWEGALGPLEALGVRTVLSSGRAPTAEAGLSLLEKLQASCVLGIMPGAGIGPQNVSLFLGRGFEAIHLSGLPRGPREDFRGLPLNSPSLLREGPPLQADPGRLKAVVDQVRGQGL